MEKSGSALRVLRTAVLLCFLSLVSVAGFAGEAETDSSKTRDPRRPEKTFGEVLLNAAGDIIELPIDLVKLMARGVVHVATETPLRNVLDIGNPIKPFYPVGGYNSNQGFKGGLGLRLRNLVSERDKVTIRGSYSVYRYQSYRLKYTGPNLFGPGGSLFFQAEYRKRPREYFYGVGNCSSVDDEVNYTLERTRIILEPSWNPRRALMLRLITGFTSVNVFDGQDDQTEGNLDSIGARFAITGDYFRPTRFITLGGGLNLDWRDNPGQPSRGGQVGISATFNKGTGRSEDFDFFVTDFVTSWYVNLFRKRILALRFVTRAVDLPDSEEIVPFYLMSQLGGQDNLRGFRSYRFVGNNAALATLEYRYPVWDIIDAFAFLDAGRVFDDFSNDLTFKNWHTDYGFGVRVWNSGGVLLRTEVAFSQETTRFYLELGSDW